MNPYFPVNKKDLLSIPNILSYFRLLLVPLYLALCFQAKNRQDYLIVACILGLSALSDLLDGKIARKFNKGTEFGKLLDPIADKVTQVAVVLGLTFRFPLMRYLLRLLVGKELFQGLLGLVMLHKGKKMDGAQWYGKLATSVFYVLMVVLLLDYDISYFGAGILIWICMVSFLFSLGCYLVFYLRMMRKVPLAENQIPHLNTISIRKCAYSLLTILLLLFVYDVTGALAAYSKQPEVTEEEKERQTTSVEMTESIYSERAAIVEDNEEALKIRLQLIKQAQENIILSTFAFHSDDSGMLVIGALLDAADRDVKVQIIVDGFESWTAMEWNPYFYALSSHENVEIRVYNKANPLTPWKVMGRMHDKYLVSDDTAYLLGGRNTYNYFLGSFPGHKNYDRDVLVYCGGTGKSLSSLKAYFTSVWNYKESRPFYPDTGLANLISVKRARNHIDELYEEYCKEHKEIDNQLNYEAFTCPTNSITLLSNPIHYQVKAPILWKELAELMNQAKSRVKIHTPYVICNDKMYKDLEQIAERVGDVSLMTNSVANNGNPFGAVDYSYEKERILETGFDVWEYEGGYSYHGKSILIDDNLSLVGSFNLDMRSAYLDTELMLVIESEEINRHLAEGMQEYESSSRKALANGEYENPYRVVPMELTPKHHARIQVIGHLFRWARFLF